MLTFGTGEQTRSLCYVDDLADGLVRLMRGPEEVTGPINPGNPQELSIGELAKRHSDWKPRTPLEDGLSRTIAYLDALLREGGVQRPLAHGIAAE